MFMFDSAHKQLLDQSFRSGKLFTPGGFGQTARSIDRYNKRQALLKIMQEENLEAGVGTFRKKVTRLRGVPDPRSFSATMGSAYPELTEALLAEEKAGGVSRKHIRERIAQAATTRKTGSMQAAAYTGLRTMGVISTLATAGLFFELGSMVGYGSFVGMQAVQSKLATANLLDFGTGQFTGAMSPGAATERQRALKAIQEHQLNARRMIGNEAALMH
jgi:hypothetical protein